MTKNIQSSSENKIRIFVILIVYKLFVSASFVFVRRIWNVYGLNGFLKLRNEKVFCNLQSLKARGVFTRLNITDLMQFPFDQDWKQVELTQDFSLLPISRGNREIEYVTCWMICWVMPWRLRGWSCQLVPFRGRLLDMQYFGWCSMHFLNLVKLGQLKSLLLTCI